MKTKTDRLKRLESLSLSVIESRNSDALFRFAQDNGCIGKEIRCEENGIHKIIYREKKFFDYDIYFSQLVGNTQVYITEYHHDIIITNFLGRVTIQSHNNIVTLADLLYGTGTISMREAFKEIFIRSIVEHGNINELLMIEEKKLFNSIISYLEGRYYDSINKSFTRKSHIETYLDIIGELLDEMAGLKQYIIRFSDLFFQTFMSILKQHH